MHAQLVPIDGSPTIEVVKSLSIVGRKEDCDIRVDHKSVSKQHCVIVRGDGMLHVRDLGSTNGTRVNGRRVRRAALLPNDQVSFASVRFKVRFGHGVPPPEPSDHTMQMGSREFGDVAEKAAGHDDEDAVADGAAGTARANQLPDLYPDEPKRPDR
jgi:pSer/pThr/pTyr-binding forkhead associated (FHA) protein